MIKILRGLLYEVKDVHYAKRDEFDYLNPRTTDFVGTKRDVADAGVVGFLRPNGEVELLKYRDGANGSVVAQEDFWKMVECFEKGITFEDRLDILANWN